MIKEFMVNKQDSNDRLNYGFTLMELIIAIAILAIMASVAIPRFINIMDNTRKSADISNARYIAKTAKIVIANNPELSGVTGRWTINSTSISEIDGDSTVFASELEKVLVLDRLSPKYVVATGEEIAEYFVVQLTDADQQIISIYASNGTDEVELYPNPSTEYEAK